MAFNTTLKVKNGYLLCSCKGVLNGTALLALAEESLKSRLKQNLSGVLADMRKATTEMSMFDAVQFGECLAELAAPAIRGRTAIVHRARGEAAARLFETALVNRSFTVRLFRDFKEAENWLKGRIEPDPAPR